jgi:hypothetical protein
MDMKAILLSIGISVTSSIIAKVVYDALTDEQNKEVS